MDKIQCPECGEVENVFHLESEKDVRHSRAYERVWFECQECQSEFMVTFWQDDEGVEADHE